MIKCNSATRWEIKMIFEIEVKARDTNHLFHRVLELHQNAGTKLSRFVIVSFGANCRTNKVSRTSLRLDGGRGTPFPTREVGPDQICMQTDVS